MHEHKHVISLLEKAKKAAKAGNVVELKKLSDMTIHSAAIYQDEDNVLVAVIIYALSKIVEKGERYYKENYKRYITNYMQLIDKSIAHLKKGDDDGFRKQIREITISKYAYGDLRGHLQGLFRKARINKAGKIYEHGISMQQTADLLGISLWELAEYSGQMRIHDKKSQTLDVKKRIKFAEEFFR